MDLQPDLPANRPLHTGYRKRQENVIAEKKKEKTGRRPRVNTGLRLQPHPLHASFNPTLSLHPTFNSLGDVSHQSLVTFVHEK